MLTFVRTKLGFAKSLLGFAKIKLRFDETKLTFLKTKPLFRANQPQIRRQMTENGRFNKASINLAEVRREDVELVAVFGDGAAGDGDAFFGEHLHDFLVGQR